MKVIQELPWRARRSSIRLSSPQKNPSKQLSRFHATFAQIFASINMPQQSNIAVPLYLTLLLAGLVLGQMNTSTIGPSLRPLRRDGEAGHPWTDLSRDQSWRLTRDMPVPAPCWRAPWLGESAEVVPYYRDRFVLDWYDGRKMPENEYYISELPYYEIRPCQRLSLQP